LILLLIARQDSAAQTVEAPGVVVTGEAIATPTPHDNFRQMRQHLMPEVSSTEITVTKKATVIKLDHNRQWKIATNRSFSSKPRDF